MQFDAGEVYVPLGLVSSGPLIKSEVLRSIRKKVYSLRIDAQRGEAWVEGQDGACGISLDTNTYIRGDWAFPISSFTKQYNLSFDAITFSGESNSSFMTATRALRIS
ncbi:hypothetical protein ACHAWU_009632 [Discostella pseudostelligera]|uniref:Peptidase A1 domain-containing protein n=1 Tax=Discostella pseudostelligera TaxID=259834 RepID=A0ABD3MAH8_9STRA